MVHTKSLSINGCKKVLVWLVAGFTFGEEYLLGYDPMMKHRDDEIITISVDGEEYAVVKKLFSLFVMETPGETSEMKSPKDPKKGETQRKRAELNRHVN